MMSELEEKLKSCQDNICVGDVAVATDSISLHLNWSNPEWETDRAIDPMIRRVLPNDSQDKYLLEFRKAQEDYHEASGQDTDDKKKNFKNFVSTYKQLCGYTGSYGYVPLRKKIVMNWFNERYKDLEYSLIADY